MHMETPMENPSDTAGEATAASAQSTRDDFTRRKVRVHDITLAVRELGDGPAFIWGHGLLTSMAQEDDVDVFDWWSSRTRLRYVRYDARGHGESSASYDAADYRWPVLARDMLDLALALGEPRAILGGVSMGCATALHAAHVLPERVTGLLLVAPPTAWEKRPRQSRIYRIASALVGTVGLGPVRLLGRLSSGATDDSIVARVQRVMIRHLAQADERAVAAALSGAAHSDLPPAEELAHIDVPALILAWRGDPIHPVSTAERLAANMPGAELVVARSLAEIRDWPQRARPFFEKIRTGV
jgi:3-oxoadipate enol-lactonase